MQQRWAPRDVVKKIVDELAALKAEMSKLDDVDISNWEPIFDPDAFKRENKNAKLADWAPDEENLKLWASLCIGLRRKFDREAEQYAVPEPPKPKATGRRHLPSGFKYSLASNPKVWIT